jgi:LysR family transcriptional regulator, carnitine catabolism transcriptional activator
MVSTSTASDRRAMPKASMGLELIELETFIAVAQAGSFSMAAQMLHVTQPTVTGRVQRLENMLDTKLLVRTTRKVNTTPQGRQLLVEATAALQRLNQLVDGFRQKARLARQRVVIAATPMLSALSLPPVIHAYFERYPDVKVELHDLQYADALAALDAGTADLAVLALDEKDARFRFQTLWTDDMVLVVPVGHPLAARSRVALEALTEHRLTVVGQYQPVLSRLANEMERCGLALPKPKTLANLNTLMGMLDAGIGITLLPRSMGRRGEGLRHVVVEIEGLLLRRNYGIALPPKAKLSTAAQSFCRFLRQAMNPHR